MDRNIQKIGLINMVALMLVGVAGSILALYSKTFSGQTAMIFIGFGFLVAAVSYFQMRLEMREQLEKMEFDELARSASQSALFNTTEAEVFPARRSREQFERYFVPGFTTLLFVLQSAGVYLLWRWLAKTNPEPLSNSLLAMAIFGFCALILFLLGKYSSGIARLEGQRLVRPGASYLLLGAYLCFVVASSLAAVEAGFLWADLYVARALGVLLTFTAIELLLNLLLEIYRPRVRGQAVRLLYDSRLVGLLSQPEGLITTAAQALDYQFGFKVSETWFYKYLEKALAWLIVGQLSILLFSTCFVVVEPGEQALLERWGRPVDNRGVLNAGLHVKLPWPVDKVYRFQTSQVQRFNIGVVPDPEEEQENTVLWTRKHYKEEFNLLVATREQASASNITNDATGRKIAPVNLLSASIPVQFQVTNLAYYAYNHEDGPKLLEDIATREVVRYLVSADLFEIMSTERSHAAQELRDRIQTKANELQLGANVLFVGLQDIHPPVKVAPFFETNNAVMQEKEAKILRAEGDSARTNALARGEATRRLREAETYQVRRVAIASAQAAQFRNQLVAFQASPDVFSERAYLQTFARGATNARKYIMTTTNISEIIDLNLEQKLRTDLLDVPLPTSRK